MCRNCRPDLQLRLVQNIGWQAPAAALQTMRWIAATRFGAAARLIAAAAPELEDVAILPPRHLRRRIVASLVLFPRQLCLRLFRHGDLLIFIRPRDSGGGRRERARPRGAIAPELACAQKLNDLFASKNNEGRRSADRRKG